MRVLKHAIIGLLIFTLVFLFLPTGQDGNAVVDNFQATTSYATTFSKSGGALTSSYIMVGELSDEDSDAAREISSAFTQPGALCTDIIQVCDDPAHPFTSTTYSGELKLTTGGDYGWTGTRTHGGSDLSSYGGAAWVCSPFAGTVIRSRWESARGRTVTIQSDLCPALLFRICHLGPGASIHGSELKEQYELKYPSGDAMTLSGAPTQYEKDNGYLGFKNSNSTWAGGTCLVKVGDHVEAGDKLGIAGNTGDSYGRHLHVEFIMWIDPQTQQALEYNNNTDFYTPTYRTSVYKVLTAGTFEGAVWSTYNGSSKALGATVDMSGIEAIKAFQAVADDYEDGTGGGGDD